MPCNARLSIRTSPKVVQRVASCNPNRRRHRTSRGSRPRRHGRCAQWREPGSGQCRILPRILYRRARRHARAYKIDPAFRAASRTTNRIPVRFRSVHAGKQFDAGGPGPGGEGWGPAFPFVSLITCTRYEMFTRYYCVHPYLAYIGASPPGRTGRVPLPAGTVPVLPPFHSPVGPRYPRLPAIARIGHALEYAYCCERDLTARVRGQSRHEIESRNDPDANGNADGVAVGARRLKDATRTTFGLNSSQEKSRRLTTPTQRPCYG